MNLLIKAEADPESKEFTNGCLQTTKAIVAENDGSKKGVAAQLEIICSGVQLPLDVEMCNRYRSTLLGHLHRKSSWNLESMDFGLFCTGMEKVVAKFNADLTAFTSGKKAVKEEEKKKEQKEKKEAKEEEEKEVEEVQEKAKEAEEVDKEGTEEDKKEEKLVNKKVKKEKKEETKEEKAVEAKLIKKDEANHGSDGCRCIGIDELEGETVIALKKKNVSYPADLGARCEAWDANMHPDCKGENPKSWCAQEWCYVDPCKCKDTADLPKPSA